MVKGRLGTARTGGAPQLGPYGGPGPTTFKWGAGPILDLFDRESQMQHMQAPPRLMAEHMKNWETHNNENLGFATEFTPRRAQNVKLAGALHAAGAERYEEQKQIEIQRQNEKFCEVSWVYLPIK